MLFETILELLIIIFVGFLFIFGVRRIIFKKREKEPVGKGYWFKEVVMALWGAYLLGTARFAWFYDMNITDTPFHTAIYKLQTGHGVNLVPFRTIKAYFTYLDGELFIINFWGNIIMFLPFGIALPILWERYRNYYKMALMSLLFTLTIEVGQLFVGRNADIDDIIINSVSTFIASVITTIIIKRLKPVK